MIRAYIGSTPRVFRQAREPATMFLCFQKKDSESKMDFLKSAHSEAMLPSLLSGMLITGLLSILLHGILKLPHWILKVSIWHSYCSSHYEFSLEAGQGKHKWFEDPWSSEMTLNAVARTTLTRPSTDQISNQRLRTIGFAIMPRSSMSSVVLRCKCYTLSSVPGRRRIVFVLNRC